MQKINHHVGYSRENECWFVRFYPYQTEQQANDAVYAFSRPAAPVEGLETVAYGNFKSDGKLVGLCEELNPNWTGSKELVTRSQAEAIIAAERANLIKEEADHTRSLEERDRYHDVADKLAQAIADRYQADIGEHSNINDPWQNALNLIQADNAALTARVKDLAEDRDSWRRVSDRLERDSIRQASEKEALETQLAAAKLALQPFATDADVYDGQSIDDYNKSFNDNLTVGDLRRARTAWKALP